MRDFFTGLIKEYSSLVGTSKIVPIALFAIITLVLLYNEETLSGGDDSGADRKTNKWRGNPALFLLSIYSGISYAVVIAYRRSKNLLVLLFSVVIICMTGELVFFPNALKKSIYTNGEFFEIVFAVVAIAFYLLIYGLIAARLFRDDEEGKEKNKTAAVDRMIFMCSMVLLNLFGFYSERLALSTLILSPLSVSSIILHGVLPFLLWIYLVFEDRVNKVFKSFVGEADIGTAAGAESVEGENGFISDDYEEEWDMKKHKVLNMRNMAIAVLVLVILFGCAVVVLNNKINTLYDATVLLNNAASDKASIYEVKNKGEICASIIVSSDGNLTVIGGGAKENGVSLHEELSKHDSVVTTWYLYGEDEASKGAYDFCKDNGITIMNTYVLDGVKELN